jgi:hypothetical protein
MTQQATPRAVALITGVLLAVATAVGNGQKLSPADVAAKMTGTWKLNRELSPSVGAPARGRTGGAGRGAPAFAVSGTGATAAGQRGGGGRAGGGGGGDTAMPGDLPPDVLAAQAAIRDLQQVADVITIKATADSISFTDPRGERTFAIDNKKATIESNGAKVEVKTKWDKLAVRQEFATAQTRLVRSWEADDEGHVVLKVRIESMTMTSKEVKAVYDRQ